MLSDAYDIRREKNCEQRAEVSVKSVSNTYIVLYCFQARKMPFSSQHIQFVGFETFCL